MKGIGWFSTGRDQAARELLATVHSAMAAGDIPGRLLFVFCNREPGEAAESDRFLEQVRGYGLPLLCLSSRRFWGGHGPYAGGPTLPPWRYAYDREVRRLLEPFAPELVVLAGYMLIVTPELCQRYAMINLHPAAPGGPAGTWQEVIWQLIQQQATSSGVMMHLVTPELDQGPPITYCTYPLRGSALEPLWQQTEGRPVSELRANPGESLPLFQAIRRRGLAREFPLIVATLRAFCQGRFRVEAGQVMAPDSPQPLPPVDLTPEVEASLQEAGS